MKLTQARLKELLRYDRRSGAFYWLHGGSKHTAGKLAGCLWNGYRQIGIDGKTYLAHRLAWLYVYGYFPKQLDHKNRNRSDNRIRNLREATNGQNQYNARIHSGHTGLRGAYKYYHRWRARIYYNGKALNLGTHATERAAHAAYIRAAKKLHGKFFNGNT